MSAGSGLARAHALVPARGGSKGLPGKNGLLLGGEPLLARTVRAGREARGIASVVLSTDDRGLAELGRAAGADVPFLRPAGLASDEASSLDVALHAVDVLGWRDDETLVLLQPTSPFRNARDIDAALATMCAENAGACIAVVAAPKPLGWHLVVGDGGRLAPALPELAKPGRRQDAPRLLVPNGAIYAVRIGLLREARSFVPDGETIPYEMPAERSLDIDDRLDFALAETVLERGWLDAS